MKKYVLITGATSGIGYSFVKVFAGEKYNIIIAGRNRKKLEEIKKDFNDIYNVEVFIEHADFSVREDIENLWISIEKKYPQIDILINNAGVGYNGEFSDINFEAHEFTMEVNMRAVTRLSYLAINHMKKNSGGKILNVASTGSFQAGPMIGVYYASKAYVLSLSVALREEVSGYNIEVVALCPGATKTEFCKKAGKEDLKVAMSSDDVAKIGYKGLMKNKAIIIPGFMNKVTILISKFMPYIFMARMVKKIQSKVIKK